MICRGLIQWQSGFRVKSYFLGTDFWRPNLPSKSDTHKAKQKGSWYGSLGSHPHVVFQLCNNSFWLFLAFPMKCLGCRSKIVDFDRETLESHYVAKLENVEMTNLERSAPLRGLRPICHPCDKLLSNFLLWDAKQRNWWCFYLQYQGLDLKEIFRIRFERIMFR